MTMKLKILCYQDMDMSILGMAKNLQEKHNCDLFSITDLSGNPQKFFREQSIVK